VKLTVPDIPGSRSLNSVASVTVKGNALYVDVWDHDVGQLFFSVFTTLDDCDGIREVQLISYRS